MGRIYRKAALEKISSPDQLDKAVTIVSPSFWLAMLATVAVMSILLAWSIFGKLPVNVSSNGIFMNRAGIHSVYAEVSGTVVELHTDTGKNVRVGDEIATLSSKDINKKLTELKNRRQAVEEVTLASVNDIATDDNKELLDIKSKNITMKDTVIADGYMLSARKEKLEAQREKTAAAKVKLDDLEVKYYLTLLPVDTNKANITLEGAKANVESARSNLSTIMSQKTELEAQNAHTHDRYKEAREAYENADEASPEYDEIVKEYEEAKQAWETYKSASDEYSHRVGSWESVLGQVQSQYEAAKADQIGAVVLQESMQAWNTQINSAYERALNEYNTNMATQRSLEDEITQIEARIAGEEHDIRNQNSALAVQFDAEKDAVLAQLDRQIKEYNDKLLKNSLRSTIDGKVTEMAIVKGQVISAGDYIARVSIGTEGDNVVVCYVPVTEGRKIKIGMKASVYPSTAKKQEYGHMRGTVVYVDNYVTSQAEIANQVGMESMVNEFLKNGPVIEVRLELDKDESTASGYWWSTRKGREIELTEGTMIDSDICVQEKSPISMIVPYIKEKITVNTRPPEKKSDNKPALSEEKNMGDTIKITCGGNEYEYPAGTKLSDIKITQAFANIDLKAARINDKPPLVFF